MASSLLTACASEPTMDRLSELDAARALLGVSPSVRGLVHEKPSPVSPSESSSSGLEQASGATTDERQDVRIRSAPLAEIGSQPLDAPVRRPRSGSEGLDALAALASQEAGCSAVSLSSDEDAEAMPPPPPRRGRRRSASNPEGMEKWDSLNDHQSSRRHFVLPAAILEEELAEASAAVEERARKQPLRTIPEGEHVNDSSSESDDKKDTKRDVASDDGSQSPEELLRRARSRLLEDLSEGNLNGEKGVLTLPHSLAKYKEVYNKNGRIGIYTPSERAAIIARFNRKRSRRVWNKKIRYNCRKSLADRRLRVKGRFVKRSEQEQLAKQLKSGKDDTGSSGASAAEADTPGKSIVSVPDEDMPDVNDPEAGFAPTEDQPYRRLRRHTIT